MKKIVKTIYAISLLLFILYFLSSFEKHNPQEDIVNIEYDNLKDTAYMYIDENDTLALIYLLKAFEVDTVQNPYHLYVAAALAGRLGKKQLAFDMLALSVNKGYSFYEHMKNNKFFPELDKEQFYCQLEKVKKRDLLLSQISIDLDSIFDLDQNIRSYYENEIVLKGKNEESLDAKMILDSMQTVDSDNLLYINSLIDEYGFLGRCLRSDKSKLTMYLIYLHAPVGIIEKRLNDIKKAVKIGELELHRYPYFEDKISSFRNGVQKYGTQFSIHNGEVEFVPLVDSVNVDKYRYKFRMESFETYKRQIKGESIILWHE